MNLTEKIIKGIIEAEFEINPELQKKQGVNSTSIVNALVANGWKLDSATHRKGGYFYKHSRLPGAEIDFWVDINTDIVNPIMHIFPNSSGSSMQKAKTSVENVEYLTKLWLDGKGGANPDASVYKHSGEETSGVSIQELSFVLDELDWQNIGNNFGDLVTVVFEHPEIDNVELTFQYTPDDMMLTKEFRVDGSPAHGSFTMPVDLDRIKKITYGWLKGEDLGPDATIEQPGDTVGIGDYQSDLEDAGWTRGRTKDSTINKGGKSRQGFSTMFTHPDTADGLRLFYDEDGTVIYAFIIHPVTGSTSIHPEMYSVLGAALGLVAQP